MSAPVADRTRSAAWPPLAPGWRVVIAAAGVANLGVAGVLTTQPTGLFARWPWELTRLSALFLAAMFAAVGAASLWIAATGARDALPAGFANLVVLFGGAAGWLALAEPDRRGAAAALAGVAAVNLGLFAATQRGRGGEVGTPLPPVVRTAFVVFVVVLVGVGGALVAGVEGVLPWTVGPGTAEVFGWIFLADAVFFLHPLRWPGPDRGRTQLVAFLGYDLVLLWPLAATVPGADAAVLPGLLVYLAVLAGSAVLAVSVLAGWAVARRSAR